MSPVTASKVAEPVGLGPPVPGGAPGLFPRLTRYPGRPIITPRQQYGSPVASYGPVSPVVRITLGIDEPNPVYRSVTCYGGPIRSPRNEAL